MVGELRRPAHSRVGASNTTSTSPRPTASRSIRARSAESTSPITGSVCRRGPPPRQREASRRAGTPNCPSGQRRSGRRGLMLRRVTDPVIRLDSDRVAVEPGGQAQVGVTISNPGSIVEGYTLDVVGEGPSSWAQVIPAELSVYPQQEARAIVTFSPAVRQLGAERDQRVRRTRPVHRRPGHQRGGRGRRRDRQGVRAAGQDRPGHLLRSLAGPARGAAEQLGQRAGHAADGGQRPGRRARLLRPARRGRAAAGRQRRRSGCRCGPGSRSCGAAPCGCRSRSSRERADAGAEAAAHAGDAVRRPQPAGRRRGASTRSRSCPRGSSRCSAWSWWRSSG